MTNERYAYANKRSIHLAVERFSLALFPLYVLIITHIFWDVFTNYGSKPSCIEEIRNDLCFGIPLYKRLPKLVGNDEYMFKITAVTNSLQLLRRSGLPLLKLLARSHLLDV